MNQTKENRSGNNPPPATAKPAFDPPGQGYSPNPSSVTPRPPQGGSGALDPRQAHNAAIVDRIVADKVRDSHLLRCIVQGCHPAAGGPCQYCGAVR